MTCEPSRVRFVRPAAVRDGAREFIRSPWFQLCPGFPAKRKVLREPHRIAHALLETFELLRIGVSLAHAAPHHGTSNGTRDLPDAFDLRKERALGEIGRARRGRESARRIEEHP